MSPHFLTLLKFFTTLVRPLPMHDFENFEDLSAQGHGQGLGADAKAKALRTLKMSSRILRPRTFPRGHSIAGHHQTRIYNTCMQFSCSFSLFIIALYLMMYFVGYFCFDSIYIFIGLPLFSYRTISAAKVFNTSLHAPHHHHRTFAVT